MEYIEQCNKFFAPLDEIIEALNNQEGIKGISYDELVAIINTNSELADAIRKIK